MNFIDGKEAVDALLELGVTRGLRETGPQNVLKPFLVKVTGLDEREQNLHGTDSNLMHTVLLEGLDQRQDLLVEPFGTDEV